MTMIELTAVGFLVGLITLLAWPAMSRCTGRAMLAAEARRLEDALRAARADALRGARTVVLDAAPLCRRFVPGKPSVRFYADGRSDGFAARPAVPSNLAVVVDADGRIRVFHEAI